MLFKNTILRNFIKLPLKDLWRGLYLNSVAGCTHRCFLANFVIKKNFMTPFYGWGSTASRLEPLRGGSLLFTTKFPDIPGTHFIDLGRMTG